jgi:glycosyltransferase involved in cell wall biosynthesis
MRPLRVLCFTTGTENEPSARFRVHQLLPELAERGIAVTALPLVGDRTLEIEYGVRTVPTPVRAGLAAARLPVRVSRRALSLATANRWDALWIQKEVLPFGLWRALDRIRVPVVYDFDDAIYAKRDRGGALRRVSERVMRRDRALPAQLARCDRVVAGNAFLASYARQHSTAVEVVPSVVSARALSKPLDRRNDPPVIGWYGAPSGAPYLAAIRGALQRLAEEERFVLRVMGLRHFECPGVEIVCEPFRRLDPEEEWQMLSSCDVGIMPLPESVWAEGKCALKAIQYMACGLPVVASPIGVTREVLDHGRAGLLAADENAWWNQLRRLLRDPRLAHRLAIAGRKRMLAHYSVPVAAERWAAIFRELCSPSWAARRAAPRSSAASTAAAVLSSAASPSSDRAP